LEHRIHLSIGRRGLKEKNGLVEQASFGNIVKAEKEECTWVAVGKRWKRCRSPAQKYLMTLCSRRCYSTVGLAH